MWKGVADQTDVGGGTHTSSCLTTPCAVHDQSGWTLCASGLEPLANYRPVWVHVVNFVSLW